jgi:hypothetical protein
VLATWYVFVTSQNHFGGVTKMKKPPRLWPAEEVGVKLRHRRAVISVLGTHWHYSTSSVILEEVIFYVVPEMQKGNA